MQPEEEKFQSNQDLGDEALGPAQAATSGGASAPQGEADPQAQIAELQEQVLRALAEAENTRRRAEEEVSKARKYAVESFAHSLLPVRDSLEMALSLENQTPEKLREGVEATLRQLANALEVNKVVEVAPPAGTRFDPHRHQAISVVPTADQPVNTVVSVLQKGYVISDRVLRPALVTVAGA